MRTCFNYTLMIGLLLGSLSISNAQQETFQQRPRYAPHDLVIIFVSDSPPDAIEQLLQQHEMSTTYISPFDGMRVVTLPDTVDVREKLEELRGHPLIKRVALDYFAYPAATPDDTFFSSQWALPKIQAPSAWDIETGDSSIIISIIDTGVDWDHPDLVNNIWNNLGEDADGDGHTLEWNGSAWVFDPGDIDGIDGDNNNFVDDLIGWDFSDNDNDPDDCCAHGTNVAGIAVAVTNDSIGVAGLAGGWDPEKGCALMVLKAGAATVPLLQASGGSFLCFPKWCSCDQYELGWF